MEKFKLPILVILALAALYVAFSFLAVPGLAHRKTMSALNHLGFDTSFFAKPAAGLDFILYRDITFDKDAFSGAKAIMTTYDPISLFFGGEFKNLEINGLNLTGGWDSADFSSLSFSGWKIPDMAQIPFNAFRHVIIGGSAVSLLTQTAGGLNISYDLDAGRKDGKTAFEAHLKTDQQFLTLSASASGTLDGPTWAADIDLEDGKFETPGGALKVTRLSGSINLSALPAQAFKAVSELRAGGAVLYGLPWANAAGNIECSPDGYKITGEAKSVNPAGLELELSAEGAGDAPPDIQGTIHAEKTAILIEYLKDKPGFGALRADLEPFKNASDTDVAFHFDPAAKNLKYQINNKNQVTKKSGEITFK